MSRYLPGVLMAAVVFAILSPVLQNQFTVYDDPEYVTENPHVNSGLTRQNAAWALTAAHSSNWHPLTWMSHALDCSIFGLSPRGHHLTNLLHQARFRSGPGHTREALFAMGRYEDAWRVFNAARAAKAEVDPRLAAELAARVRR